LLQIRFTALSRALVGARAGDVTAIHQARVATRRLREVLPLLESASSARKLARTVRQLTRALGPVRELDVTLQTLGELETAGDVSQPASAWLRRLLEAERRVRHADAAKVIDHSDLGRVREKALATGTPIPAGSLALARASAQHRAAARAGRLQAAIEAAAGMYLPDRLHAVRIAVKKLRYAIEVARQVRPHRRVSTAPPRSVRSVAGQLAALKRAQELLGRMHDLEVLIAKIREVQGSPQAPSLRVSGDLDRLARKVEMECRVLHGHYMASRARLLQVCDRVEAHAPRDA
jgi:CHAD domain-containing protein